MNAEPELYPQEALADDEPRYLRRQRPLEIRRRKFRRKSWPAYRRWLALSAGLAVAGWLAFEGARFLYSSPRLELSGPDQIEITGAQYTDRDAITAAFEPDLGRSILRVPLADRRAELETIPWVARASLERSLPDRIRVEIAERVPVAFLRDGSQLALVDADGVILDRPLSGNFAFPVVSGFGAAMPLSARAQRMDLFVQFMKEIDLARHGAGEQVSEIDLADAHDLRATLSGLSDSDQAQPVLVHFGDDGFVNKYRLLRDNFASWSASAGPVQSIDLRFSGQVVVNPERKRLALRLRVGPGPPSRKREGIRSSERRLTKKDRYLVALDLGSTKTCALIAEIEDGGAKFLAMGAAESKGSRKGLIVNLEAAVGSIRHALEQAESVAGVPVESAVVGVAGGHVRGVNSRGGIALGHRSRDIEREDVRRAVDAARAITLPEDREVLHVLPQEFLVDNQDNIRDPIGMMGQKLEVNVHIVTASAAAAQNVITAVNRAGVVVTDTALETLASAEAVLTLDERELGCCLLDIGGGTSELIVYSGGVVRHTAALPVGGDHFTNDLAVGLRTPIPEAEKIKREHGCAWHELVGEDKPIEIASVGDRPPRTVFARMLNEIIEPRAQELLALVRDDLKRAGFDASIPAGLILSGGGARLSGLVELSEHVFSLPVRVAAPRGLEGMPAELSQPEYATAVGLLLYGAHAHRAAAQRPVTLVAKLKSMFAGR